MIYKVQDNITKYITLQPVVRFIGLSPKITIKKFWISVTVTVLLLDNCIPLLFPDTTVKK